MTDYATFETETSTQNSAVFGLRNNPALDTSKHTSVSTISDTLQKIDFFDFSPANQELLKNSIQLSRDLRAKNKKARRSDISAVLSPAAAKQKRLARLKAKEAKKKEFRSDEEIAWRADVGDAMRAYASASDDSEKWIERARKWDNCSLHPKTIFKANGVMPLPSSVSSVWVCPSDNSHDAMVFCASCDNRGCADCANRQSARLANRYVPVAQKLMADRRPGERMRHITFTTPVSLQDPDVNEKIERYMKIVHETLNAVQRSYIRKNSAQHKELKKRYKNIRTSGYNWKKRGGAIVGLEFGPGGLKLHFHVAHFGEYISQVELSDWFRYLSGGQSYVVDLRGITTDEKEVEGALMETLKYATKFWKSSIDSEGNRVVTFIDPDLMPKLMQTLDGTRRVRTYGVFHGVGEPEKEKMCCSACQSEMVKIQAFDWNLYERGGLAAIKLSAGLIQYQAFLPLKSILANNSQNAPPEIEKKPENVRKKERQKLLPGMNQNSSTDEYLYM